MNKYNLIGSLEYDIFINLVVAYLLEHPAFGNMLS